MLTLAALAAACAPKNLGPTARRAAAVSEVRGTGAAGRASTSVARVPPDRLAPSPKQQLYQAFDGPQCYAYVKQIVGFGERWPGSPGHAKTEVLVKSVVTRDGGQFSEDDFTASTPRGPVPVHNLIGKFNVSKDPNQPIFILAGHYDTLFKKGFVGANDGGSSTAILLSFADALRGHQTRMQIWLVWTDLEEAVQSFTDTDGLYGSKHLAQKLSREGLVPRIKGFFLMDMIGDKDLNVDKESTSTGWLQDFIASAARQLGYTQYFFQYSTAITDDQDSFAAVGIPVVDVVDAEFGKMPGDGMGAYHHTNQDTLDKVSEHSLLVVGQTTLKAVQLLDAQAM